MDKKTAEGGQRASFIVRILILVPTLANVVGPAALSAGWVSASLFHPSGTSYELIIIIIIIYYFLDKNNIESRLLQDFFAY